ncbi:universal stress protein [Pontibacter rugosus]|uniref:Universal stress protein n=1 Tax=Pontibacter rugosus TaxID=1745966 RepID=A0ABW3SJS9_9BACT
MNTLTRITVGLDLTEMDETLIRYAAFLCSQSAIEQVYFVHTEKHLDIPAELIANIPAPVSEAKAMKQVIEQKVKFYFDQLPHVQVQVQIIEGSPVKEMLHHAKETNTELILVGRKLRLQGSGVLAQKLLRSGRVSVLFVSENAEPVLGRIVVSVDFSEYSMMALERLLHSALALPSIEIVCLHVYEVPSGYITLGESFEAFDDRMRGFAKEKFDQVLQRFPQLEGRASLKLVRQDTNEDLGGLIVLEARRAQADLLVIGAKGKSAAALFVLGSVTEKVLRHNDEIPLLVFKNRKESIGFLDAILGND